MRTFRLAMAQINVTVGDLDGNTQKIVDYIDKARSLKANLVAFPELAIPGYPPEDLLFKPQFINDNLSRMRQIVQASDGMTVVVGFVDVRDEIHNAAAIACDGQLEGVYHKIHLPNYGVFDEGRYFKPGNRCPVYRINDISVGVNICEDIWHPGGPALTQRINGAEVIININGSPFYAGKRNLREEMLRARAVEYGAFVAYVNLVGGQDELVFDGASMIVDPEGGIVAQGAQFEEAIVVADLDIEAVRRSKSLASRSSSRGSRAIRDVGESQVIPISANTPSSPRPTLPESQALVHSSLGEIYAALVLGTRDYVHKCGFDKVLVAMSGGIDSSLVATVAVDALGNENVVGVTMPSRFSSQGSVLDAQALAENLGIEMRTIPIEELFSAYIKTLSPHFEGTEWGIAEENVQSRIRGNLIMALSNKFGWLVLTTGNKSEMATGYTTIYGDMAGGFDVIKDVSKTLVYQLAEYRNSVGSGESIPQEVLEKPPSAELRPGQKDEDSLPPYSTLDLILQAYVEDDKSFDEIVGMGFLGDTVKHTIDLVDFNEYKRRQAPPGIKITPRNFGRDRRMPIANRYKPY